MDDQAILPAGWGGPVADLTLLSDSAEKDVPSRGSSWEASAVATEQLLATRQALFHLLETTPYGEPSRVRKDALQTATINTTSSIM